MQEHQSCHRHDKHRPRPSRHQYNMVLWNEVHGTAESFAAAVQECRESDWMEHQKITLLGDDFESVIGHPSTFITRLDKVRRKFSCVKDRCECIVEARVGNLCGCAILDESTPHRTSVRGSGVCRICFRAMKHLMAAARHVLSV